MEDNRPVVLVSGFGPFGIHKVNASWASIQEINKENLEKKNNIKLVQVEIPVVYETVDKMVPDLWNEYTPKLVIHVGVSANATKLTLESVAHGYDYTRLDCDGVCPSTNCNDEALKKIQCKLNVDEICESYNKQKHKIEACVSKDAGRYLCEYTYFSSLKIDAARTLFVHVPDISEQFTKKNIAKGLESIIETCLNQLCQFESLSK